MEFSENKKNLVKYLEALAIDASTTYVKKVSDGKKTEFYPLANHDMIKRYNNCYNNCNDITAIIIENKMFIIPTGIINELYINFCDLHLEKFNVPLSDDIYFFKDKEIDKKWKHLLFLQDNLKSKH